MFINKQQKSYKSEYVINSITSDKNYKSAYKKSVEIYKDNQWCEQFTSQLLNELEIISIRNVCGIKDGFYIVDRNYTKFCTSSFITKKAMKTMIEDLIKGTFLFINKDKSINKFFIQYIKQNTINYYSFDEYIKEFNPQQQSHYRWYQPNTKSAHTVNGFWRNQPYGSRQNPQYKRIWVNSFDRGSRKVA